MTHPAIPPRVSLPWIAAASLLWLGLAVVGTAPAAEAQPRPFAGDVVLLTDIFDGQFGQWALGRIETLSVLVDFEETQRAARGDTIEVKGRIEGTPGIAAGHAYSATLDVEEVNSIVVSGFWPHQAGMWLRRTVSDALEPYDDGRALLAGFLIGDTSRISTGDVEAMRRSGLSHFVAVSGSNVALFLGFLAVVSGPLALGPKRRALVGLAGLPVYVAATRFEPSVVRAAAMAGMALTGRLIGIVFEAWQLLSLAVVVLLIADPGLTDNVGFQLSVVATAGVLIGARWPVRGRVRRALAVTVGAQLAVAPLLLLHFGSVPLMSPLVNLIVAPLVVAATLGGAIGAAGVGPGLTLAAWFAELVLAIARGASGWPQMGYLGVSVAVLGLLLILWRPSLQAVLTVPAAIAIAFGLAGPNSSLPGAAAVVFDVGQGDSILLKGGEGRFALVDGGPDPAVLVTKLREYGVTQLELVVLTHVHADHATGLSGVVGEMPIGEVWLATEPHTTSASTTLLDLLSTHGVPVSQPGVGQTRELGVLGLVVNGPVRRYASPNDQSIVLTVLGPDRSMLLSGDIETFAQADLDHLRADVLKVPHQGGATSDPAWLEGVGAGVAVVSVGPNNFGHPAGWVIDVLADSGADVIRTDEVGDVVVDLGR